MKSVLIVGTQGWNQLEPKDYADFITAVKGALEAEVQVGNNVREPAAEVEVVANPQEAEAHLRSGRRINSVVFVSRGEQEHAERLAKMFPRTRMTILTGLIPDGLVVWVSKHWIGSSDSIREHVLD